MPAKEIAQEELAYYDYQKAISKIPVLPEDEMRKLVILAQNGDKEARDKVIEHNLRLVSFIAKRYARLGSMCDIIQNGNLGLMKSIDKYDITSDVPFPYYAANWITGYIMRFTSENAGAWHIPIQRVWEINKVERAVRKLTEKYNRQPTYEEIADETKLEINRIKEILMMPKTISLNDTIKLTAKHKTIDASRTIGEIIPSNEDIELIAEEQNCRDIVGKAVNRLSPKLKEIVTLRFGLDGGGPHTLQEIADIRGCSRENIRQLEKKALDFLKNGEDGDMLYELYA